MPGALWFSMWWVQRLASGGCRLPAVPDMIPQRGVDCMEHVWGVCSACGGRGCMGSVCQSACRRERGVESEPLMWQVTPDTLPDYYTILRPSHSLSPACVAATPVSCTLLSPVASTMHLWRVGRLHLTLPHLKPASQYQPSDSYQHCTYHL